MPTSVRWKILNLADQLGTKLVFVREIPRFQYDGSCIFATSASNAIHDLAHFQICAPERRFLPDFGLLKGPQSKESPPEYPSKVIDDLYEEVCASMLGIMWEFHMLMRWKTTLLDHNWDSNPFLDGSNFGFFPVVRWLEDRKLIVGGAPQLYLRTESDQELTWSRSRSMSAELSASTHTSSVRS